ncbi:hypothetical protein M231_06430 [Tremella mesenterica]|uniref:Uncharacterized protein n=1 Tax=Tremella mesenterica TaxID=5217 RepID=A0A4Q1BE78_TREME|nr:hypothetical protein M231_06430 [Tremella mesenterica]
MATIVQNYAPDISFLGGDTHPYERTEGYTHPYAYSITVDYYGPSDPPLIAPAPQRTYFTTKTDATGIIEESILPVSADLDVGDENDGLDQQSSGGDRSTTTSDFDLQEYDSDNSSGPIQHEDWKRQIPQSSEQDKSSDQPVMGFSAIPQGPVFDAPEILPESSGSSGFSFEYRPEDFDRAHSDDNNPDKRLDHESDHNKWEEFPHDFLNHSNSTSDDFIPYQLSPTQTGNINANPRPIGLTRVETHDETTNVSSEEISISSASDSSPSQTQVTNEEYSKRFAPITMDDILQKYRIKDDFTFSDTSDHRPLSKLELLNRAHSNISTIFKNNFTHKARSVGDLLSAPRGPYGPSQTAIFDEVSTDSSLREGNLSRGFGPGEDYQHASDYRSGISQLYSRYQTTGQDPTTFTPVRDQTMYQSRSHLTQYRPMTGMRGPVRSRKKSFFSYTKSKGRSMLKRMKSWRIPNDSDSGSTFSTITSSLDPDPRKRGLRGKWHQWKDGRKSQAG